MASARRLNVPAATSSEQSLSYSSAEPSHQWTASGVVRAEISSTQARSFAFVVGTVVSGTGTVNRTDFREGSRNLEDRALVRHRTNLTPLFGLLRDTLDPMASLTSSAMPPRGAQRQDPASLLDLVAELGDGFAERERAAVQRDTAVQTVALPLGAWSPQELDGADGAVGFLVAEGAIVRDVRRVRPGQIGVRALGVGEALERAGRDQL